MSGKDYQRVIRGHFLVHATLTKLLVDVITNDDTLMTSEIIDLQNVDDSESYTMEEELDFYNSVLHRKIYFEKNFDTLASDLSEGGLENSCLKNV